MLHYGNAPFLFAVSFQKSGEFPLSLLVLLYNMVIHLSRLFSKFQVYMIYCIFTVCKMCRLKMGNNVSELVPRPVYLQRIAPFMRTPVVKALIGSRRVGKSYILLQLMRYIEAEEKDANIIYINKEDLQFAKIRTYRELNDYLTQRLLPEQRNYIFVDEIQEIEEFGLAIRSLALDEHNDIYVTGSNSLLFSGDLANAMGGRYVAFRIYSLSYTEFLEFHQLQDDEAALEKDTRFGGFPYLRHLPLRDEVVLEYLGVSIVP